ncbi:hypothetical protein AUK40_06560 [Candidatus Wirthbacteria bacterium CG2_30_54_11]|uniref:Transposase IS200-like domain-containing protein n=1 Tax=Candidatus Wirthbacteria bacterium CG2_30_54_11 TaxID=1817892 RepID=A0A1J5IKG7_9BACT|nr:MAG: hypothetical protein AUK40_06560 [Candidatus Wirthbacteria bacterium CG2_30_54_11]
MIYAPRRHHRRSIRLQGYDYSQAGAYFITLCTERRERLFGKIVGGEMILNDAGVMVQTVWEEIPRFYPGVDIDVFQLMPDHAHGIIVLTGDTNVVSLRLDELSPVGAAPRFWRGSSPKTARGRPLVEIDDAFDDEIIHAIKINCGKFGQARGPAPTDQSSQLSLPDVVHRFKTMTTKRYADGVKGHGWLPFPGRLWQRNYYERVIRDDAELERTREYIIANPGEWKG